MRELFRKLGMELATRDSPEANHRFNLAGGLFVYPEGICPFCEEVIKSNRIWLLRQARLMGRWKISMSGRGRNRRGRLNKENRPSHPHVEGHGSNGICLGAGNSEPDRALFFGMNPRGAYWVYSSNGISRWYRWLRAVWDHDCPNDLTAATALRRRRGDGNI